MINLLFMICAIDILYLINKLPNLFISKPIIKFIIKIVMGIILTHLLLKAYTIITFKDTYYLEIKAIILIVIYVVCDLAVSMKKWL